MLVAIVLSLCLFGLVDLAAAAPFAKRAGVTPVPLSTVSTFDPYTRFASAAYAAGLATWQCGAACDAIPGVVPYASGGDGRDTPFWFVGYWPQNNSVVIAHEGTNATSFSSWLNDADFFLDVMDAYFFPGAPPTMRVHTGFQEAFRRSATNITEAVEKAISERGTNRLTIVGHSLGGAIAQLDTAHFRLLMPTLVLKTVVYGSPRVGNTVFADYLSTGFDLTRINNKKDIVPTVASKVVLGYQHATGEIHINNTGHWNYCAGQENDDPQCTAAQASIFLTAAVDVNGTTAVQDHSGPYNGISM